MNDQNDANAPEDPKIKAALKALQDAYSQWTPWWNGEARTSDQSWQDIFERDQYRCVYCGHVLNQSAVAIASSTIDHLVPRDQFRQGDPKANAAPNIVACCSRCNAIKSNHVPKLEGTDKDHWFTRAKYIRYMRAFIAEAAVQRYKKYQPLVDQPAPAEAPHNWRKERQDSRGLHSLQFIGRLAARVELHMAAKRWDIVVKYAATLTERVPEEVRGWTCQAFAVHWLDEMSPVAGRAHSRRLAGMAARRVVGRARFMALARVTRTIVIRCPSKTSEVA